MRAFYNEIDRYCCDWLSNLMDAGHITPGKIDDRSIEDLSPDDLRGYERAHFFAGIGGWDHALNLANWGTRPVWTGSCPCQPFSAAGAGKAADDERHLWPRWFPLIAERRPAIVFGEQVEAAIGWGWLDAVFADLEQEGYACGATVLPACGVGAPHIRARTWFVGALDESECGRNWRESRNERCSKQAPQGSRENEGCGFLQAIDSSFDDSAVANSTLRGRGEQSAEPSAACGGQDRHANYRSGIGWLADADGRDAGAARLQRGWEHGQQPQDGRTGRMDDSARTRSSPEPQGWLRGRLQAGFGEPSEAGELGHTEGGEQRRPRQPETSERRTGTARGSGSWGDCPVGDVGASGLSPRECAQLSGSVELDQGRTTEQPSRSPWADLDWLPCTDGKARPVEPGTFPLAHGIPGRVGRLRAYGNAIVPQVAAEFIRAADQG